MLKYYKRKNETEQEDSKYRYGIRGNKSEADVNKGKIVIKL